MRDERVIHPVCVVRRDRHHPLGGVFSNVTAQIDTFMVSRVFLRCPAAMHRCWFNGLEEGKGLSIRRKNNTIVQSAL